MRDESTQKLALNQAIIARANAMSWPLVLGHPVCGDAVYRGKLGLPPIADASGAPRLALHAAELGFVHPASSEAMHWDMPLPEDLRELVARLRKRDHA